MTRDPHRPIASALRARIQEEPWARAMGVEYLELREGYCRVGLALQPHMLNHQGRPHGGVIFSLADTAFGASCNSYGAPFVALHASISYVAAVAPGAMLYAESRARRQGRRAGFYDVAVTAADGTLVALFHGVAHGVPDEKRPAR